MNIAIDFDGTIVELAYPDIGALMPYAKKVIQKWKNEGHTILINTCRVGEFAKAAKDFLIKNGVPFDYFNENSMDEITFYGHDSRKICADIFIDDKNIGGLPSWPVLDLIVQRHIQKEMEEVK
jgi:hypothetical protein